MEQPNMSVTEIVAYAFAIVLFINVKYISKKVKQFEQMHKERK